MFVFPSFLNMPNVLKFNIAERLLRELGSSHAWFSEMRTDAPFSGCIQLSFV